MHTRGDESRSSFAPKMNGKRGRTLSKLASSARSTGHSRNTAQNEVTLTCDRPLVSLI